MLEDLSAHLTEVAAEDPTPLRDRLGPPAGYAADLRAAADPAVDRRRYLGTARLAGWWERTLRRLRRLDLRVGPLIGYERLSEFGRLLVPAWWVLRGYLAAMVVVAVLDQQGQIGLLPRLGGSTLAGPAGRCSPIQGARRSRPPGWGSQPLPSPSLAPSPSPPASPSPSASPARAPR